MYFTIKTTGASSKPSSETVILDLYWHLLVRKGHHIEVLLFTDAIVERAYLQH